MMKARNHIPGHVDATNFLETPLKNHNIYSEELTRLLHEKTRKSVNYKRNEISPLDFAKLEHIDTNFANQTIKAQIQKLPNKEELYDETEEKLTQKGVNYISSIINKSINYYTTTFLLPVHTNYKNQWNSDKKGNIHLKNHDDVIRFLQYNNNNNSPTNKQTHCSLLKVLFCMNDINIHLDKINNADKIFEEIKKGYIYPNFLDYKNKKVSSTSDEKYIHLRTRGSISNKSQIYFSCSTRSKNINRILLKMLANSQYTTSNGIKDIYGIRNEVKTKEEALSLLEYWMIHVCPGSIKHKNIFGKNNEEILNFIEENKDLLDEDFYTIAQNIKNGKEKGNQNYQNVKITGNITDKEGEKHAIEIQINLVNNKNETGYSHHSIYELTNTIEALIRLQGYCPIYMVEKYINKTVDDNIIEALDENTNPELLYLGGLSEKQNYRELAKENQEKFIKKAKTKIKEYLENNFLLELNLPRLKSTATLFTTENQRNKFHEDQEIQNMYPNGAQVLYQGNRINTKIK